MWERNSVGETKKLYGYDDFINICLMIKNYYEENGYRSGKVENKKVQVNQVVEGIRTVAEILIWEDQNNETLCFGYICEYNVIDILVYLIIERDIEFKIRRQSLQTISILLQNMGNMQTLYYILSKNVISVLLNNTFSSYEIRNIRNNDSLELESNIDAINKDQEEYDELVSYYIVLLRTLAMRLNNETVRLFYDENKSEFPLWTNSCHFINYSDQMIRNISRNVILNILGNNNDSINAYVVYEEIRHYNSKQVEEIMKKLSEEDIDFKMRVEKMLKINGLLKEETRVIDDKLSTRSRNYQNVLEENIISDNITEGCGLIQAITSNFVRQIYELTEFVESNGLEWPEIEEYMFKLLGLSEENCCFRDEMYECGDMEDGSAPYSSSNYYVTPIKATSPITLSYSEVNSPEPYSSPVVNQLSASFYESSIKPLRQLLDRIYETLELINEIVSLNIKVINALMFDSLLKYIFNTVIFQNISIIIHSISHCMEERSERNNKENLSLRIYLYLAYHIISYFYQNNYNLRYNDIIDRIWKTFFDFGRNDHFFGNIFSTLINYVNNDSEFVLIFGLIDLNLNYYFNSRVGSVYENNPFITLDNYSYSDVNVDCQSMESSNDENDIKEDNIQKYVPNFVHSFVDNFMNYFQYKKHLECDIMKEIEMENRKEIYNVDIEFNTGLGVFRRHRYSNTPGNSASRRSNSLPAGCIVSDKVESNTSIIYNDTTANRDRSPKYNLDSILTLCRNYKRIHFDFERAVHTLDMKLKSELGVFYSKINCESDKRKCGYMLYIVQFFEKILYISNFNSSEANIRPFCLLIISFLISDIVKKMRECVWFCGKEEENKTENYVKVEISNEKHKSLVNNEDEFEIGVAFESVLSSFLKYYKLLTLRSINDILKKDLITDINYTFYEKMGNINYIICEHFFEWKEEDELLITKLFENKNDNRTFMWIHNAISNHCSLIGIGKRASCGRNQGIRGNNCYKVRKYIWNLIDTYPFLRWFPNTISVQVDSSNSRSIYIDRLRSNYNSYQILERLSREIASKGSETFTCGEESNGLNNENSNMFPIVDKKTFANINKTSDIGINHIGCNSFVNDTIVIGNNLLLEEKNKIRITLDNRFYRVTILRANNNKKRHNSMSKINSIVIFDNENKRLLFTTGNNNNNNEKRASTILVCKFHFKECKPVPIVTRSHKVTRYLVGLLVRYKRDELKDHVYLRDIMYELPHRDELLNSPNVSRGAIIQTKKNNNKMMCHLNNLLLPIYTRYNLNKDELFINNNLNYSDYALYMEFESKKKLQDFIKRLNNLRKDIIIEDVYNTHSSIYNDLQV
ncbi:hypothetical protein RS030_6859 [Cryptosporidium xiaoi]|uniref:FPL domain-containing protein n=1 Tax=Cryptosporidium xiaoi TaxID=659607 RepID=A0AAV9XWA1_9CRYT